MDAMEGTIREVVLHEYPEAVAGEIREGEEKKENGN